MLTDCNENATTKYWKAPAGQTGSGAELTMDLGCMFRLHRLSLRNGFGDFGVQKFSLWGARTETDSWLPLYNGTLADAGEEVIGMRFEQ